MNDGIECLLSKSADNTKSGGAADTGWARIHNDQGSWFSLKKNNNNNNTKTEQNPIFVWDETTTCTDIG